MIVDLTMVCLDIATANWFNQNDFEDSSRRSPVKEKKPTTYFPLRRGGSAQCEFIYRYIFDLSDTGEI